MATRLPAGARPPGARDVERELSRARFSRRLVPWALATALGGGAIAFAAGGGLRAGLSLAAIGLVFVAFLWATSVARCPACGAPLPRTRRPAPRGVAGPAEVVRIESCPSCRTRFDEAGARGDGRG